VWFRAALVALVALCAWVAYVYAAGFVGISNDDASRALIAWDFARAPSLDPTRSSWLPVHTYVMGAALRAFPWLDVTPRVLSALAALVAVLASARLTTRAGVRPFALALALLACVSWRWTVLPSAAGAVPEMPCVALVMIALWALGRERATVGSRLAAGVSLALACGHRYEAWCAAFALVAVELYLAREEKSLRRGAVVLALMVVIVPVAWLAINHARSGDAFDFAKRVVAWRRAEGPLASVPERVVRYPWLVLRELPLWVPLALVGARWSWVQSADVTSPRAAAQPLSRRGEGPSTPTGGSSPVRHPSPLSPSGEGARGNGGEVARTPSTAGGGTRALVLRCAGVALAVLAFLVYGEVRGGGPTHHHARTLLLVAWALVPLVAAGVDGLVAALETRRGRVVAAVLCAAMIAWARPRRDDWQGGVPADAVAAGDRVAELLKREGGGARWYVELERLDFLWVELRSGAPERAIADRVYGRPAPGENERVERARTAHVAAVSTHVSEAMLRRAGFVVDARRGGWVILRRE
jgi:hypothetical protein